MRYAAIYPFDISNGPGIRVSLFVQGCDKHCPGCFNKETWDFSGGKQFNEETISELLRLAENEWISGLSILGGEPLHPNNISSVITLCKKFKDKYPNKTIWIWTGYTMEEIRGLLRLIDTHISFSSIDAIIDGPFIESEKDLSLKWRGSSNQRIWMKGGTGKMDQNPNEWYCIE